jgi:hypothetical protein
MKVLIDELSVLLDAYDAARQTEQEDVFAALAVLR